MRQPLRILIILLLLGDSFLCKAQNPYLPLWEYIPDGEPYVFEDPDHPGHFRVYVYGSHDDLVVTYCGRDQVVWSAPVENLTDWRYDGVIFRALTDAVGDSLTAEGQDDRFLSPGKGDILYAPDVALVVDKDGKKHYYLYPNNQARGRENMVCESDRPDGPFHVINWSLENPKNTPGTLWFDPAVFVDDDGRVYGYWGFQESCAAELDPLTMATVKPGTEIVKDMISNCNQPGEFRFFEASSIRKIEDKYVFIYSRMTYPGEFGLPQTNYTLAYAYSDNPLGPFTYGGTLIDGRARGVDAQGNPIPTANPYGNTHGSIVQIDGQWWVFYHRQTDTDEFSRQAMVAPVNVTVEPGKGGKVVISEGEYTSEGFFKDGLDPLCYSEAGWACYLTNPKGINQQYPNFFFSGSYIRSTRVEHLSFAPDAISPEDMRPRHGLCPVVNNTSGSVIGYKYFRMDQIGKGKKAQLALDLLPMGQDGTIQVMLDAPTAEQGGKQITTITLQADMAQQATQLTVPCKHLKHLKGKHALFFVFRSAAEDVSLCELYGFRFSAK